MTVEAVNVCGFSDRSLTVDLRLEQALSRIETLEGHRGSLPTIHLSGFFQLDDGLFSQPAASRDRIGDAPDGVSFRRARLQAFGKLTEFTTYSIMMDGAQVGDDGGVAFASRITHLVYYNDLAEDRYLLHMGAGGGMVGRGAVLRVPARTTTDPACRTG